MSSAPALKGPAPKPGRYVKISIFLRKLPHITDEYFHAYWANNHIIPALANKLFVEKVRRYNQVSSPPGILYTVRLESSNKSIIAPHNPGIAGADPSNGCSGPGL